MTGLALGGSDRREVPSDRREVQGPPRSRVFNLSMERHRPDPGRDAVTAHPGGLYAVMAVASLSAAGVHFGAAGEHLQEYAPAGVFMLLAGLGQFVWAIWIAHAPSQRALALGAGGNAAVVVLWAVSRTAGLPFGAQPWMPEHIHGPDVLATALEIVIVLAALAVLADPELSVPWSGRFSAACLAATLFVTGDDPAHERMIASATIALGACTWAVTGELARMFAHRSEGRSHVTATLRGIGHARQPAVARAGHGAGE